LEEQSITAMHPAHFLNITSKKKQNWFYRDFCWFWLKIFYKIDFFLQNAVTRITNF
jgi:hypothetical protein